MAKIALYALMVVLSGCSAWDIKPVTWSHDQDNTRPSCYGIGIEGTAK